MKINLDYELIGKKEPVIVLLHGWGMDKSCFKKLVPILKTNQKIVSLDFFGFGKSSVPRDYFDTYEYACYVFLLLKKLNINNVILVGHSFGGRIAILLSSIFKLNVSSLILTSSAGINKFSIVKKLKIFRYKFLKSLAKYKIVNKKYLEKFGSVDYKKANLNLKKVFVRVVNQDLKYLLYKIDSKCTLVWDKKDKETPYSICNILNRKIKNSKILNYSNGGHFAFLYNINKFADVINMCIIDKNL